MAIQILPSIRGVIYFAKDRHKLCGHQKNFLSPKILKKN